MDQLDQMNEWLDILDDKLPSPFLVSYGYALSLGAGLGMLVCSYWIASWIVS